jgi:hypothetical protein
MATATVADAAPPPNDDFAGATVVTTPLPFVDEVDTSEATTTPEEAAYNDFCGAPAMDRAVWYTSTAAGDADFAVFDVRGSDYGAGILVLAPSEEGELMPLACQPGSVSGPVSAGQQLWFMVFDDGTDPGGTTLRVEVRLGIDPPDVELTVDPVASVDRFGVAYLSGTVSCTSPDGEGAVFGVEGSAHQRVGRASVNAFFFVETPDLGCDGTTVKWTAEAVPDFGDRFSGGKAATVAFSFACGTDQCSDAFVETTVMLRRNIRR